MQSAPFVPPSLALEVWRDGLSCDEGRMPVSRTPGSMFMGKYLHCSELWLFKSFFVVVQAAGSEAVLVLFWLRAEMMLLELRRLLTNSGISWISQLLTVCTKETPDRWGN